MRVARRTGAAVFALALTTDGKILAAGDTQTVDEYGDLLEEGMLIARFDSAGRPDRSFGSGGTGVVDLGGRVAQGRAVAALPDGRVLVAGSLEVDSRDPEPLGPRRSAATPRSDRSFLRTPGSAARSECSGRLQSHFALAGQRRAAGRGRRGRFQARAAGGRTCRPDPGAPGGRRTPTQGVRLDLPAGTRTVDRPGVRRRRRGEPSQGPRHSRGRSLTRRAAVPPLVRGGLAASHIIAVWSMASC
ncbi:hypothetical protein BH20ACT18_BH20ACT18_11590 [soil metagenome]